MTDALTDVTSYEYSNGLLTAQIDETRDLTTSYAYDDNRRLTLTSDPAGGQTSLTYDSFGNVSMSSELVTAQ